MDLQEMAYEIANKHYASSFTDQDSLRRWILSALESVQYETKHTLMEEYESILEQKIKEFSVNKPVKVTEEKVKRLA